MEAFLRALAPSLVVNAKKKRKRREAPSTKRALRARREARLCPPPETPTPAGAVVPLAQRLPASPRGGSSCASRWGWDTALFSSYGPRGEGVVVFVRRVEKEKENGGGGGGGGVGRHGGGRSSSAVAA